MRKMSSWVLLVVVMGWGWTGASADPVRPVFPPKAANLAELVASGANDLVVKGIVLNSVELVRPYAGTCGVTGLSPLKVTDVRLRVDGVVYGAAEDSILDMTILDQGFTDLQNKSVLVWAHRSCEDNWHLRGWMCVLSGDQVLGAGSRPAYVSPSGNRAEMGPEELLFNLRPDRAHPSRVFEGTTTAIALARVTKISPWTSDGSAFYLDSLSWVVGRGGSLPKVVTFPMLPMCNPQVFVNDSLLVPVPQGFQGDTLKLQDCPVGLRVKNGYAPGLGVTLQSLSAALVRVGSFMRVRPLLRKDQ